MHGPVHLTRTVRFCVNPPGARSSGAGSNGFAGRPPMAGLGRYYELDLTCEGPPDPATGYLVNIKAIDDAARRTLIPRITDACEHRPEIEPANLLLEAIPEARDAFDHPLVAVSWRLSPWYRVDWRPDMGDRAVLVRQQFDLAAAHRLHVPGLGDEANRALFGKCNNPAGHGHNYRLEACVRVPVGDDGPSLTLGELERLVERDIIAPFDHTHLNEDTDAFRTGSGRNPSVENIAAEFFERLAPGVWAAAPGAVLESVTVWETDRTCCTYPAPSAGGLAGGSAGRRAPDA